MILPKHKKVGDMVTIRHKFTDGTYRKTVNRVTHVDGNHFHTNHTINGKDSRFDVSTMMCVNGNPGGPSIEVEEEN